MHTRLTSRFRFLIQNEAYPTPSGRIALVLAVGVVCLSCDLVPGVPVPDPPLGYVSVEIVVADRGALHRHAGIHFVLANVSEVRVASAEVAFDLYDGEGSPVPGVGVNACRIALAGPIAPGEQARYAASLDEFHDGSRASLTYARFRVTRATLADGSVWRNPGSYVYAEGES